MSNVIPLPKRLKARRPKPRKATKAELNAILEAYMTREPPRRRVLICGRAHAGPSLVKDETIAKFHVDYFDEDGVRKRVWSGDRYRDALAFANERYGGPSEIDIREATR
jgi:hypothetical protein